MLCLAAAAGLLGFYAFKVEPFQLAPRVYTLGERSASAAGRVKIIQLSDIQISEAYKEDRLDQIVSKVNGLEPDIVVFTGDLFDNYALYHTENTVRVVAKQLGRIQSVYGKFAIWGNRDRGGGASRVYASILEEGGFTLLCNETADIWLEDGSVLKIGGSDDVLLGTPDRHILEAQMEGPADYRILLVHEPDYADEISAGSADLILSGHSHGGQVRLPFFKGITTSMAEKYIRGFYDVNGMKLYVNTGIGTSHIPVRFMVVPQIAVFEIGI